MYEPPTDPPPPQRVDPYRLDPDSVQAPPPTLGRALRQIGPGLILAASIVGTGELIATTNLGAQVGFALLPAGAAVAALAMFGITGVGATELVSYPYWCIEKGYARYSGPSDGSDAWLARARGWMRVLRLDAWLSMVVYTIATLAFYILGAATLQDISPDGLPRSVADMLSTLAAMYAPVMGAGAALLFMIVGAFVVLYSTFYSATAANARTLTDFLGVNCGLALAAPATRRRWVALFCILFPPVNVVLFILIQDPLLMVLVGAFAQAVTLPILGSAALYLRYRRTEPRLRPGVLWDVFLWLSVLALTIAAAWGVYDAVVRAVDRLKSI